MIKLLVLLLLLAAVAGGAYHYYPAEVTSTKDRILSSLGQSNEGETVSAPGIIRGVFSGKLGTLTRAGIGAETNRHRQENQVPALSENSVLNQAAEKKLQDMFARQYFEHVAPDGTGPSDVVDSVGYRYIRVGENLALGNFVDDKALVQAWMDSPGHRANILSPKYAQIGIAAARGQYEGHTTWLAVQTFALPLSACPTPKAALQQSFDTQKKAFEATQTSLKAESAKVAQQQDALNALSAEIEKLWNEANEKIREGNAQTKRGNEVYEQTGSREQAQPYWDRGETLQAEGEALRAQADAKKTTYDARAAAFETVRDAYNVQVQQLKEQEGILKQIQTQLNAQIDAFNSCLKK